jgi:hypothetical protein
VSHAPKQQLQVTTVTAHRATKQVAARSVAQRSQADRDATELRSMLYGSSAEARESAPASAPSSPARVQRAHEKAPSPAPALRSRTPRLSLVRASPPSSGVAEPQQLVQNSQPLLTDAQWARGPPASDACDRAASGPRIQTRLEVSRVSDPDEREAEAFAETIAAGWAGLAADWGAERFSAEAGRSELRPQVSSKEILARACSGCGSKSTEDEECTSCNGRIHRAASGSSPSSKNDDDEFEHSAGKERVRRASDAMAPDFGVPAWIELGLRQKTGGSALPTPERLRFERALGMSFRGVRIHHDAEAGRLARSLQAHAFTYGRDIFFAPGKYQPHSPEGVKLLAHELTHVVQQGAASAGPSNPPSSQVSLPLARAPPAGVQSARLPRAAAANLVAMGALAENAAPANVAPESAAAINADAADSGKDSSFSQRLLGSVIRRLAGALVPVPPGAFAALEGTFAELVKRGSAIVDALKTGDCEPLFGALRDLGGLVEEVGNSVWKKVQDLFDPVTSYVQDKWATFQLGPLEAAKRFGGDVAGFAMEVLAKGKDALFEGVEFVKSKMGIGGPKEGPGLFDRAWAYVRDQTRPMWEPYAHMLARLQALGVPPWLAGLSKRLGGLGQSLRGLPKALSDPTGDTQANQAELAKMIPRVKDVLGFVASDLAGAREVVSEGVSGLGGSVKTMLKGLQQGLLRPLTGAFTWLDTLCTQAIAWVKQGVAALFNLVIDAVHELAPLLAAAEEVATDVVGVVSDLMSLPVKLLGKAWNKLPECLRAPIQKFFIEQFLERVPLFVALKEAAASWEAIKAIGLKVLRQVFVDKNLSGALWTVFTSAMKVLGIPAELIVEIAAKALEAASDVLGRPIVFLTTALQGAMLGFLQFGNNILDHLKEGVIQWLLGAFQEAKVQLPEKLTPSSVLELVLQTLNITVEHFYERLAEHPDIGPEKVTLFRKGVEWAGKAWDFLSVLNTEGVAGLGRLLLDKADSIWGALLGAASDWITAKVVKGLIARVATSAAGGPFTAVLMGLKTVYDALKTIQKHKKAIVELITRTLDKIAATAKGDPAPAAQEMESGLGRLIAVAIDFAAQWVGLGGIGDALRGMIEGLKEKVTAAMDWLIDKAVRAIKGLVNLVKKAKDGVVNWLTGKEPIHAPDGSDHTLQFDTDSETPRLMVHSYPQDYDSWLEGVSADKDAKKKAKDQAAILDALLKNEGNKEKKGKKGKPGGGGNEDNSQKILAALRKLAGLTEALSGKTTRVYGDKHQAFGTSVTIEGLKNGATSGGSAPSAEPDDWCALNQRRKDTASKGSFYVRGHLLNGKLGGTGADFKNLTPLTRSANALHETRFESFVKDWVEKKKEPLRFVVKAVYGRSVSTPKVKPGSDPQIVKKIADVEAHVPLRLECRAETLDGKLLPSLNGTIPIENDIEPNKPYVTKTPKPSCTPDDEPAS